MRPAFVMCTPATCPDNWANWKTRIVRNAARPWWSAAEVTIFGAAAEPKEVRVGDQTIRDWHYDAKLHAVTLTAPDALKSWPIHVVFETARPESTVM